MDNNLNILVEAKKEYVEQLCNLMGPVMIETFNTMYNEAVTASKGKNVLQQYQKFLKEVPNWNNHMIHQHTENLSNSCAWFNDLLAAVFVSYVKILSSVRLTSDNKKISIKLPTNEVFTHGCYLSVAKELYQDPYIYQDDISDYDRSKNLNERIRKNIESTIKEMVPIQKILHTYISQGEQMSEKDIDLDHDATDGEDPDILEDDPLMEPEEPPSAEPITEGPEGLMDPSTELDPTPDPESLDGPQPPAEVKNINFAQLRKHPAVATVQPPEEEVDDVLFGDAPEK